MCEQRRFYEPRPTLYGVGSEVNRISLYMRNFYRSKNGEKPLDPVVKIRRTMSLVGSSGIVSSSSTIFSDRTVMKESKSFSDARKSGS